MLAPKISPSLASLALAALIGCSSNPAGNEAQLTPQARQAALAQSRTALLGGRSLANAQWVEDLTHGPAVGLADEAAGLAMEFGHALPQFAPAAPFTIGNRLSGAEATRQQLAVRIAELSALKSDPQPGDVLFTETRQNLDGSVTILRVIQDAPQSVVRIEATTTWPHGHLLLDSTYDSITVERGADLEHDSDDVLFALLTELRFHHGAKLRREIDERADGGIVDGARVEVLSTFVPRTNHPLLEGIQTRFVLDVHELDLESDDRFVSAERLTRFVGVAHVGGSPRVEERLAPEFPVAEGEEPCGGTARRTIHFARTSELVEWTDEASFACAGGGQLARTIHYADGSTASFSLREDGAGVVTLEALERDGATTQGSFSDGSFSLSTRYAAGSDPTQRSIEGQSNPDGSDWSLDEKVEFLDGFKERNHLEGRELSDRKQLAGSHAGREETVEFELSSNLDETKYEGEIHNDRGESLRFAVEVLADLSRIVHFVATNPTTRVEGNLVIGADGCGKGTLIVDEGTTHATIEISFCENVLRDDAGQALSL